MAVLRGDLDDLDALRKGAADADGVVHLANKHDWSNPAASNAAERGAVETIAEALVDTHRPFVLASGVAGLAQGRPSTEEDASPFHGPDAPRGGSENLGLEYVARGVHTVSARFAPTVHGPATTASSRTSPPSPARRASRRTSATARTAGRPYTARTPPGSCASGSSRRPPGHACTPWPRRASRPG